MKGIGRILLYLLAPRGYVLVLVCLGLLLMALAVPVALLTEAGLFAPLSSGNFAVALVIWGFGIATVIPFLISPIVVRDLLANVRLVMVPGLKVSTGIALLIFHVMAVLFLPLAAAMFTGTPIDMPLIMLMFAVTSLYSGVAQLMLPSRHLIFIVSTLPLLVVLVLDKFGPLIAGWLGQPSVTVALFIAALAGWGYAFRRLARHEVFTPRYKAASNEEWIYYGAGWLNNHFNEHGSPTGSLLLGYSDGFMSRMVRAFSQVLLTPLIALVFMYVVSMGNENNEVQQRMVFINTFLILILFSVVVANQGYGELAARCRFLWLRQGHDRESQWRLLEGLMFSNIGMVLLFSALPLVVMMALSRLSGIVLMHLLALIMVICLFSAYFRIYSRLRDWAVLDQHVIVVCVCLLLGAGWIVGVWQNSWLFLVSTETGVLVLAALARHGARRDFLTADWLRVRPKEPACMRSRASS